MIKKMILTFSALSLFYLSCAAQISKAPEENIETPQPETVKDVSYDSLKGIRALDVFFSINPEYALLQAVDGKPPRMRSYPDRDSFAKENGSALPDSISFFGKRHYFQIARPGVFADAYLISMGRTHACSANGDKKEKYWKELANQFDQGRQVEMDLVARIMENASSNCTPYMKTQTIK